MKLVLLAFAFFSATALADAVTTKVMNADEASCRSEQMNQLKAAKVTSHMQELMLRAPLFVPTNNKCDVKTPSVQSGSLVVHYYFNTKVSKGDNCIVTLAPSIRAAVGNIGEAGAPQPLVPSCIPNVAKHVKTKGQVRSIAAATRR